MPETPGNSLANTTLTDHELIIHAVQHLEDLTEQLSEAHGAIMRLDAELTVFLPLLRMMAPGGKPDMVGVMQARRELRRATRI